MYIQISNSCTTSPKATHLLFDCAINVTRSDSHINLTNSSNYEYQNCMIPVIPLALKSGRSAKILTKAGERGVIPWLCTSTTFTCIQGLFSRAMCVHTHNEVCKFKCVGSVYGVNTYFSSTGLLTLLRLAILLDLAPRNSTPPDWMMPSCLFMCTGITVTCRVTE